VHPEVIRIPRSLDEFLREDKERRSGAFLLATRDYHSENLGKPLVEVRDGSLFKGPGF
jgi:hypothetical protein